VLVEGAYSGILKPQLHYFPLKRDFSNLDDVLEKIKNPQVMEEMSERAYDDIYISKKYSYQTFALRIEQAIE